MAFLELRVRNRNNLYQAWTVVRANVLSSGRDSFKKEVRRISENPWPYLDKLQRALRKGDFYFDKQEGYLKKTSSGKPRPIVVAPIKNRIVQRAILNVLQCDKVSTNGKIGNVGKVIRTATSVGGVPDRGVAYGIHAVRQAIKNGATYYIRSDIKQFFTSVPKSIVCDFVEKETKEIGFSNLFKKALETELANADEVKTQINLFPITNIGVPQGSSLSAFAGNVVLQEFDLKLNGRNITTIRYIDDFVILGPDRALVRKAFEQAKKILVRLGMDAYSPTEASDKAKEGFTKDGFDFLGCTVRTSGVSPSKKARESLIEKARNTLASGHKAIDKYCHENEPRRAENSYIQTLALLDDIIRGWGDAFAFADERLSFNQLDNKLQSLIDGFLGKSLRRISAVSLPQKRRALGIALLQDTEYKLRNDM